MTIVVKIGGAAIEDAGLLHICCDAVLQLARQGQRVAVVHGGGKTLSRTLQRLGIKSEFVDGLRVTNPETRDVALMVLAGLVNKKLVASIERMGAPALGLCGGDGMMFFCRKKASEHDLGFVGEISAVDEQWLELIWQRGGVPVLASVALGEDGEYYNINADEMASACAAGCHADLLAFLTDVAGVRDVAGRTISSLSTDEIANLIADSVVTGGMMPKLQACTRALQQGVSRVQILAASDAAVLSQIHRGEDAVNAGTSVTCNSQKTTSSEGVTIEFTTAQ